MRINIINLDKERWILTKFSKKLALNLTKLGHTVFLSKKPRTDVDVNHFIIFLFQKEDANYYPKTTINTTMLTHVNDDFRFKKIKSISKFIDAGIAFSSHHKKFIEKKIPWTKKIFYVLPPTDNDVNLKKLILEYLLIFIMMEERKKIIFLILFLLSRIQIFLNYQL